MRHKREFFRVAVNRTGQVTRGTQTIPCQLVNLSEKGFRLRMAGSFVPNEVVQLEFALSAHDLVACTVQVIYTEPPFLGAVVTGIPSHHRIALSRFIDEVNTLNMLTV